MFSFLAPLLPGLRRSRGGPSCAAAGLLLAVAGWAQAAGLGQQVERIEANYGHEPAQVIARLAPLEAPARAAGAGDLVTFLAAWGYAHAMLDKPTVADAAIAELSQIGAQQQDAMAQAAAYALKATMLQYAGQLSAAYGWIAKAVPQARQSESAAFRYWVFMSAGHLAMALGRLDEAMRDLEDAGEAAREDRNHRRRAQVALGLAPLHMIQGRDATALQQLETAHALVQRGGEQALLLEIEVMQALVAEHGGNTALTRRLRQQTSGAAWADAEREARLGLASLYLSALNYPAALAQAQRAGELSNETRDTGASAQATIYRGMALLGQGQVREGRRLADIGFDLLQHSDEKNEQLLLLHRYSALLDRHGEPAAATARMREALLLETELLRQDRLSTVLELQRKSSSAEQQREVDALQHENSLQAAELGRSRSEQRLTLAVLAALGVGALACLRLFARVRKANRQLAARHAELEYLSSHDRITGLQNRRQLDTHGQRIGASPDGRFLGVGIAIKRFGLIVGNLGHEIGDQLLQQIGQRLSSVVTPQGGTLYRLDGLSFGCIFPEGDLPHDPFELLAALTQAMEAPFFVEQQELTVTACMGAAAYPRHGSTPAQVARCVELATLHARTLPGNSYIVYSEEMRTLHRDRLNLETRLRQALELGEFSLHYQPQCDLRNGRLSGFEALLRWKSREGPVSPAQFIPLAEETGLIVPLGRWVLAEACRQARDWADAGLGRPMVAINISPRQFQHPGFLQSVREVLQDSGADPTQIELEITEGAVMQETETTIALLHALRGLGLHLAIDDFGTGYASLAYLRRFPLNRLKIDQSFIRQLTARPEDAAIVHALIQLSHSLGLEVVAEGVEQAEQEACLRQLGCDIIQGYGYAMPAPAAVGTGLLQAQRAGQVRPAML